MDDKTQSTSESVGVLGDQSSMATASVMNDAVEGTMARKIAHGMEEKVEDIRGRSVAREGRDSPEALGQLEPKHRMFTNMEQSMYERRMYQYQGMVVWEKKHKMNVWHPQAVFIYLQTASNYKNYPSAFQIIFFNTEHSNEILITKKGGPSGGGDLRDLNWFQVPD
ncbi:hypothetical protein C8R42DRAFT_638091 [Lentinula raphanica]|nr:hypothetical protein C8R42DRAFT_638091 [Lentinula raphanica]